MKIEKNDGRTPFRQWVALRSLGAVLLALVLMVTTLPAEALPASTNFAAASTLTFTAEADARVHERYPDKNYGNNTLLLVIGPNNPDVEGLVRFTVSGTGGSIQSARLRLYVTTNNSSNSPAVYGADNNWTETGVTWNNRPARISNELDNLGSTSPNTWVEYDVTGFVTGNQTYTFALVADSGDGIDFSSREGGQAPTLVVTFASEGPTPTSTKTATATSTVPVSTATHTPGSTATLPAGSTLTFAPAADARVTERFPDNNYGTQTILTVNGIPGERLNSYLRFTTSGIGGSIQRAALRVYSTNNATTNGPAVHLAGSDWIESGTGGIKWNNQPALLSGAFDNKGAIGTELWVEYDVTALVTGNGTYTFAFVADARDGVTFSSREGAQPPQLVVTLGSPGPTATATWTPTISPTPDPSSVVLVGAGDIASCNWTRDELTAQLLDNIPGTVFTAGDNVYDSGTYTEYVNCYGPTWGRHKSRTRPSPGNHEYLTAGAAGYFQYFDNTPAYYAYDLGAWRIYSLNSEVSMSSTSAQVTWLQNDLAANPRQCVLAYWHKPRWSSGARGTTIVQNLWQILYDAGAELVINGHDHFYERFAPMNASGAPVSQGLREIVAGTGGAPLYAFGTPLGASEVRNNTTHGVLKITLHETSYEWEFVPVAGSTFTDSGSTACR